MIVRAPHPGELINLLHFIPIIFSLLRFGDSGSPNFGPVLTLDPSSQNSDWEPRNFCNIISHYENHVKNNEYEMQAQIQGMPPLFAKYI
jgi:hypothetical protein